MVDRYPLSEGSLRVIMQGGEIENPIMQVLGSKKIASGSSDKERYRILLSDGKYLISFAMFTTHINERMVSGELPVFSIIKIKRHITSVINNTGKGDKRVLVILDVETLVPGNQVKEKIGNPQPLPEIIESASTHKLNQNSPIKKPLLVPNPQSSVGSRHNDTNGDLNQTVQGQLTHTIASLSPYQNKWIIRARVVSKSPIKHWSNSRGEGKLFSMDLIDESGEIRVTAFRDLVDKFYDMIEVDKVYYISKCQLKIANKQFSSIKNDYEMTLHNDSIIQLCQDEVDMVPHTQFAFVPIDKIGEQENDAIIDVIGVCKAVGDLQTFKAKSTGRELKKREVTLVDTTSNAITLTLWGEAGENFDGSANPVVAVKGARIGEFGGGKNISGVSSTILKINPDIEEAHRLRGWFENGGIDMDVTNLSARTGGNFPSPWMSFKAVKQAGLGNTEKGDYYQTKGTVILARPENITYKACPTESCNKKIIDLENGMFRCEKCNREFPNFKYRLMLSANIADWSGNQWLSMFSSEAEKLFGMTAEEVGMACDANDDAAGTIASKANFKQFVFKCRAKFETYNDEQRLKTIAVKAEPVNYKEYNAYLISRINELKNEL